MDLSRFAFARPHVLLVESPGGTASRLALERVLRERGWPLTDSPADADILAVAGTGLRPYADRVWAQLPGPRARVDLAHPEHAGGALDGAQRALFDGAAQGEDAATRSGPPSEQSEGDGMPAGLDMADRAPDRDGLLLDVLHVPWGPALPWWPAGLVLHSRLQGDVLAEVEVSWVGDARSASSFWTSASEAVVLARTVAAARLDALGRLLAVAGWEGERLRAQRVRDALLDGGEDAVRLTGLAGLQRLHQRVGRSRTLARMTSGLGRLGGGDVTARYRQWLTDAIAALESGADSPVTPLPDDLDDVLTRLLTGTEVSSARLVVASLDPWLTGALVAGAARD
ncbi:hypothetical protein BH18ACT7_BH18ACT7_05760 [soil metagenome]